MNYYSLTEKGSRDKNEDSIGIYEKNGAYVFIVADGLGGHSRGEVASQIAIDTAKEIIAAGTKLDTFFDVYFEECEKRLVQEQDNIHSQSAIKTTVVMGIISSNSLSIAHVGDSRLYLFRKNKVLMRTLDHSVPQMLAIAGDISEKKIRNHPDRNRLLKVMGERQLFTPDKKIYDTQTIEMNVPGDAILLCTDGFWELITEHDMEKTLKRSSTAQDWCNSMMTIINKNGRKRDMDNYSAICIMA